MLINPNVAIQQGWLKFPDWMSTEQQQKCIQPNAIDLTADSLFAMSGGALLSETSKVMRTYTKLEPKPLQLWSFPNTPEYGDIYLSPSNHLDMSKVELDQHAQLVWAIKSGEVYDVMSDFYVTVPEGVEAELVIRSTLNRCGLAINSGIWDSGFKGHIGMALFNRADDVFYLAPHTRICQIKFTMSDSAGTYAGGYNTELGQRHWAEE